MARINATSAGVRVEGLKQLSTALRKYGRDLQRELKDAGLEVAEGVAQTARGLASSQGGVAAKTAPSIRAHGYTTGAAVSLGGSGYPFAGGAEFGAVQYKQFKPWRGSDSSAGYFLYPAIRQDKDEAEQAYSDALDRLARKAGLT